MNKTTVFISYRLPGGRFCDKAGVPGTDQELLEINANKIFFKEDIYEPEVSWVDHNKNIKNDDYYNLYEDVRSKQAASTAFLYDKEMALCEMFAASNWGQPTVI